MPELTIDYEVLPHQKEFLECPARYAVVCSGTKAGKSTAGAIWAAQQLTSRRNVHGVWVAPTFSQSISIGRENIRQPFVGSRVRVLAEVPPPPGEGKINGWQFPLGSWRISARLARASKPG